MKLLSFFILHSAFCLSAVAAGIGFNTQPIHGLVAWYTFNEGAGSVANDYSGMGNTGYLTNSPTWTNGVVVGGLAFNGSSTYASAGNNTDWNFANTTFTVSLWFNAKDLTYRMMIANDYSSDGGWGVSYYGKLQAGCKGATGLDTAYYDTTDSFATNTWHHVAAITTTSTTSAAAIVYSVYVDGVLVSGTRTITEVVYKSPGTPRKFIAVRTGVPLQNFFNGSIDDVRIYSRALTADEIKMLYNGGTGSQR